MRSTPLHIYLLTLVVVFAGCDTLPDEPDVSLSQYKIAAFTGSWFEASIYILNPRDNQRQAVAQGLAIYDSSLTWSPDGSQIAFESEKKLFAVNTDGTQLRQLTNSDTYETYPAWSPNGVHIAFLAFEQGGWKLYSMEESGLNRKLLSPLPALKSPPAWSPSGNNLAFATEQGIYILYPNGSVAARLTDDSTDALPVWSPNGVRLLFRSERDGNKEIYVIRYDGTGLLNLSEHPREDDEPAWSSTGEEIVFTSRRDEVILNEEGSYHFRNELYASPSDSSAVRRLTNRTTVFAPSFEPQGTRVAISGVTVLYIESPEVFLYLGSGHSPKWSPVPLE